MIVLLLFFDLIKSSNHFENQSVSVNINKKKWMQMNELKNESSKSFLSYNFANNDLPKCIEKGDNFALGCKINQNIEWKSDYPNEKSEDFYNILYRSGAKISGIASAILNTRGSNYFKINYDYNLDIDFGIGLVLKNAIIKKQIPVISFQTPILNFKDIIDDICSNIFVDLKIDMGFSDIEIDVPTFIENYREFNVKLKRSGHLSSFDKNILTTYSIYPKRSYLKYDNFLYNSTELYNYNSNINISFIIRIDKNGKNYNILSEQISFIISFSFIDNFRKCTCPYLDGEISIFIEDHLDIMDEKPFGYSLFPQSLSEMKRKLIYNSKKCLFNQNKIYESVESLKLKDQKQLFMIRYKYYLQDGITNFKPKLYIISEKSYSIFSLPPQGNVTTNFQTFGVYCLFEFDLMEEQMNKHLVDINEIQLQKQGKEKFAFQDGKVIFEFECLYSTFTEISKEFQGNSSVNYVSFYPYKIDGNYSLVKFNENDYKISDNPVIYKTKFKIDILSILCKTKGKLEIEIKNEKYSNSYTYFVEENRLYNENSQYNVPFIIFNDVDEGLDINFKFSDNVNSITSNLKISKDEINNSLEFPLIKKIQSYKNIVDISFSISFYKEPIFNIFEEQMDESKYMKCRPFNFQTAKNKTNFQMFENEQYGIIHFLNLPQDKNTILFKIQDVELLTENYLMLEQNAFLVYNINTDSKILFRRKSSKYEILSLRIKNTFNTLPDLFCNKKENVLYNRIYGCVEPISNTNSQYQSNGNFIKKMTFKNFDISLFKVKYNEFYVSKDIYYPISSAISSISFQNFHIGQKISIFCDRCSSIYGKYINNESPEILINGDKIFNLSIKGNDILLKAMCDKEYNSYCYFNKSFDDDIQILQFDDNGIDEKYTESSKNLFSGIKYQVTGLSKSKEFHKDWYGEIKSTKINNVPSVLTLCVYKRLFGNVIILSLKYGDTKIPFSGKLYSQNSVLFMHIIGIVGCKNHCSKEVAEFQRDGTVKTNSKNFDPNFIKFNDFDSIVDIKRISIAGIRIEKKYQWSLIIPIIAVCGSIIVGFIIILFIKFCKGKHLSNYYDNSF